MLRKILKRYFKIIFISLIIILAAVIIVMPWISVFFVFCAAVFLIRKYAVFFKKRNPVFFKLDDLKKLKCYVTGCSDIFGFSNRKRFSFDKNYIINYNISTIQVNQNNPAYTGYQALLGHELFIKTEKLSYLNIFDNCINWIYENHKKNIDGIITWEYYFDYDEGGKTIKAPWNSCIASAFCISALLRKYKMSAENKYLDMAVSAAGNFFVGMENGGYLYSDDTGDIYFLEEYPLKNPVHIFDGFVFALIAVYELYLITGDQKYNELFNKCAGSLKRNFKIFDFYGIWSNYGNYEILATDSYHNINTILIEALWLITGDDFFKNKADSWNKFKNSLFLKILILIIYYVKYFYFIIRKNWNRSDD